MEFETMEKLAAFEHRIDTAREKLAWNIKLSLMDVSQAIEEIKIQLKEAQERQRGNDN